VAGVAVPSYTASRQQIKICAASNKTNADQSSHMDHIGFVGTVFMVYSHVLFFFIHSFCVKKVDTFRKHCTMFTRKKTFRIKNCIYLFVIM
jgi:hypothetical protein